MVLFRLWLPGALGLSSVPLGEPFTEPNLFKLKPRFSEA